MTGGNAKNIFNPNFRRKDSGTVSAAKPGRGIFTSSGMHECTKRLCHEMITKKAGPGSTGDLGG